MSVKHYLQLLLIVLRNQCLLIPILISYKSHFNYGNAMGMLRMGWGSEFKREGAKEIAVEKGRPTSTNSHR